MIKIKVDYIKIKVEVRQNAKQKNFLLRFRARQNALRIYQHNQCISR